MANLRVMIFNAGYLTGITGASPGEYVRKINRVTLPNTEYRAELASALSTEIDALAPHILYMTEIRPDPYIDEIASRFVHSTVDVKYRPESPLRHIPYFRRNSNGIFLREHYPVEKHYLSAGTKRLMHMVDIADDFTALFVHFALRKHTRKKQFAEVAHVIRTRAKKRVILAGDFNIFSGPEELDELMSAAGLRIVNDMDHGTFPTKKPRVAVDLFLASHDLPVTGVHVLSSFANSDHVPVVVDVQM